MGFGLGGTRSVRRVSAAFMLAVSLVASPVVLSLAAHAESSNSEDNRFLSPKKKAAMAGAPASDLSAASKVYTKTEIVAGQNIAPMLSPSSASQMEAILSRYQSIVASGGFPKVPNGSYKKGSKGAGVAALNQRLFQDGYLRAEATQGEFASLFTTATQEAVVRFQRNMGLNPTGKIDGATLAQLNVPAERRLRTIQVNIGRLKTYEENLGDRYLVVNVPSQQLETVQGGKVYSRHNVIVGRPERPTPVVMTALDNVAFNPYWNAPVSIVEKDIIPKLQAGTGIIEELNIKVFDGYGGPEIDPKTVDWDNVAPDKYFFREEPGPKSAMATAKINFPSPFGIYLHDTPDKQLFASSTRYYSSGCVRVENMPQLVEWVLNGQEGIGAPQIAALAETLEQKVVTLVAPPQLRVAYLTAWPVGNTVAFRNDIYDLDSSGYVTGQPMPVGELSDDGLRYILKPVPRKASAVDEAEAEGFSIFSSSKKVKKKPGATTSDASTGIFGKPKASATTTTTDAASKPAQTTSTASSSGKAKAKPKKDFAGLFDWEAYRKKQGSKSAATTKKSPAKKKIVPAAATATATPTPTLKPTAKTAIASAQPADSKKPVLPKPVAKPKAAAATCKPDASGKLPAGCAPAATAN